MLPVLREAGVVDAGGAGLVEIVRGLAGRSRASRFPPPSEPSRARLDAIHQELSRYRYCTVFVVEGDGLDADDARAELEQLGDSLLVVGDRGALKVHVHTDDPGAALTLGTRARRSRASRSRTCTQQTPRGAASRCPTAVPGRERVVAVAAGRATARCSRASAPVVVEGGQTMNPSTAELVAAIEAAPADEVIVLPNNANVILSAEQARPPRRPSPCEVVPTRSIQAGLAALVAFDGDARRRRERRGDAEALAAVATGEVTVASRTSSWTASRFAKGAWLGLADGEPVAGGDDFDEVAARSSSGCSRSRATS